MTSIVLIAHNLRSSHNVGSLLRTAEGLGVATVYLTGYTPYPQQKNDERLPHLARKVEAQIVKTALGAEKTMDWQRTEDVLEVIRSLRGIGFEIAALEQAPRAVSLPKFKSPEKVAIIVGREVEGIEPEILAACDTVLEIPMFGSKESYNVVQAAAMAMYHCRFTA